MEYKIRQETAQAILDLLSSTKEGMAAILLGQDLIKLNDVPKTETDIMLESQAKRPERVDT